MRRGRVILDFCVGERDDPLCCFWGSSSEVLVDWEVAFGCDSDGENLHLSVD